MIRFRCLVQTFCLVLFLILLTFASISGIFIVCPDLFLRMDPGLVLITSISSRIFLLAFIPAVIVVAMGPVTGRIFCGYVCPMGITIDLSDALFGAKKKPYFFSKSLLKIKYLVLVFLIGSAVFGVSYIFFASPLSLITRFYGLILFPVASFLSKEVLDIIRPLGDFFDINGISFAKVRTLRFATQFFIFFSFIMIFSMVKFSARFWCRYLCPSGALIALASGYPLIRRQVLEDRCTHCGKCVKKCPMAAIEIKRPENTLYSECIVCRTCEEICPENAVIFRPAVSNPGISTRTFSLTRRQLVSTGVMGAGTAVMSLTGLNSLYGKSGEGQVRAKGLVRPPGALEETFFLSRCVRCGECMAACPTNTLQPVWFKAGFPALFSPGITPRRGFCDPQCHTCGQVCPTGAIRPIAEADRIWAKTGTARIFRQKCLAWEFEKRCMVCDEVCPYDAIELVNQKDVKVPVPHVNENKCAGCGYCEHFCPVQNQAAIVVTPMDALRLNQGKFEEKARLKGFELQLKLQGDKKKTEQLNPEMQQVPAPGFDEE